MTNFWIALAVASGIVYLKYQCQIHRLVKRLAGKGTPQQQVCLPSKPSVLNKILPYFTVERIIIVVLGMFLVGTAMSGFARVDNKLQQANARIDDLQAILIDRTDTLNAVSSTLAGVDDKITNKLNYEMAMFKGPLGDTSIFNVMDNLQREYASVTLQMQNENIELKRRLATTQAEVDKLKTQLENIKITFGK